MSDATPEPPGALARWHAEMHAGTRGDPARPTTWTHDALWEAACWEYSGANALSRGDPKGAASDFAEARRVLTSNKLSGLVPTPAMVVPRARRRRVSAGLEGLA
jgi:hypothetical protein